MMWLAAIVVAPLATLLAGAALAALLLQLGRRT